MEVNQRCMKINAHLTSESTLTQSIYGTPDSSGMVFFTLRHMLLEMHCIMTPTYESLLQSKINRPCTYIIWGHIY